MCVCGFVLFSNHASEAVDEGLAALIPVLIVIGLAWQVALILRSRTQDEGRSQKRTGGIRDPARPHLRGEP
jgi:hypothetical protein